jgi:uncharacterized membrane-anchored protein YitT (DUF2179 family)
MHDEAAFRRVAAISAFAAGLLSLAASVVSGLAVDFDFESLENPVGMLTAGLDAGAIGLFRWGEILGVFGYCLLFIPLTLYLWYWLNPRSPRMVTLYTALALTSIALCVIESVVRISIWPPMMLAYPQAAEAQREVLQVVFRAMTDFTFEGLYAINSILGGLWLLGIGLILRAERRALGIAAAIMGVDILGAGIGWLLRVDPLARLELLYFFQPFWLLWLGIVILRHAEKDVELVEMATSA